eukprot:CAMPEP_0114229492 /NCGR_PEP_ID=MMETSP0058-20121206/2936_1 /TAXON_ID=36894 /ORGANISM="Pyramimonas parkeae, CCMP726" /LENGTH=364 /DNA_ID=CAMNT_0001340571 /DNA_START=260 /DNA_END=1354 /DNA_ORIENTATION=-
MQASEGMKDNTQNFMKATQVQPKEVDKGVTVYRNAEQDHVQRGFSNSAHVGIRSLPNALTPNFRQQLYKEVISNTKKNSSTEPGTGTGGAGLLNKADLLSVPVAKGQRKPAGRSAAPAAFTLYEYQPTEFGREKELKIEQKQESKAKWVAEEDFKVQALPSIPKHTGAFNEFEYALDPYEAAEEQTKIEVRRQNSQVKYGALKAGGKIQRDEHMKSRTEEMIGQLSGTLKKDWPASFLRTFEDPQGLIVVCYDKQKMGEGDITSYMNQFFRTNGIVQEFKLRRDTTRWGVMEDTVPNVYYVFIPPWVHARIMHPELSQVPDCKPVPGLSEPAYQTGRVPFMPTTESGLKIQTTYVQTYARSFKT